MIGKIKKYTCGDVLEKINEIVDAVNRHEDIIRQIGEWGSSKGECLWCEKLTEVKLDDPYAEQRKWIGKLCWFWFNGKNNKNHYGKLKQIDPFSKHHYTDEDLACWDFCEPVKPDDDIIYKGGDNE